ncbi:MAG: zinc-binding dehydrogenase, partial [Candidatus Competibacteraceae bacterium]|nr:zinc-binding dehydrogenase [Candidatus Competibacteraceae bacterium]
VFYSPLIFGGQGSYAEYHVADESIVACKPRNLNFLEAASLPLAGCTAWDAIEFMQLRPGHTVLIHAAAGGVGSLAVQMAKAAGARVLVTCRQSNDALVRSLGADETIDYRSEDFVPAVLRLTEGEGVDAVYDTVGGDTLARSIEATKPYGHLASIVDTSGDLNGAYSKNLRLYFGFMERARAKMEVLRVLAERGQLRPLIDSVLPFTQVADAHRRVEQGGVKGKVVLQVLD